MNGMFRNLLLGLLIILVIGIFFGLIRAIIGPRNADRIMGINMIGSFTTAAFAVVAVLFQEAWLLDICLIYCLISFLAVVVLAKANIAEKLREEQKNG